MTQDTNVIHTTTVSRSPAAVAAASPGLHATGTPYGYSSAVRYASAPTTPAGSPYVTQVAIAPGPPPFALPNAGVAQTTTLSHTTVPTHCLYQHVPQQQPLPVQHVVETVIPCAVPNCQTCRSGVCNCANCIASRASIICSRDGCNSLVCACQVCKDARLFMCAVHSAEVFNRTNCTCVQCVHSTIAQMNSAPTSTTHVIHVVPADAYWAVGAAARSEAEKWVSKILNYPPHTLTHMSPQDFQALVDHAVSATLRNPIIYAQRCPIHGDHIPQHICEAPRPSQDRKECENWVSQMLAIPIPVLCNVSDAELNNLIDNALHKQHELARASTHHHRH